MGAGGPIRDFNSLVVYVTELISLLVPIIFGLILVVLIWRLIDTWIINAGDESKRQEGRQTALIGIIVLVVLSGIWGIITLLRSSFFGG
jgi:hypothetical protein